MSTPITQPVGGGGKNSPTKQRTRDDKGGESAAGPRIAQGDTWRLPQGDIYRYGLAQPAGEKPRPGPKAQTSGQRTSIDARVGDYKVREEGPASEKADRRSASNDKQASSSRPSKSATTVLTARRRELRRVATTQEGTRKRDTSATPTRRIYERSSAVAQPLPVRIPRRESLDRFLQKNMTDLARVRVEKFFTVVLNLADDGKSQEKFDTALAGAIAALGEDQVNALKLFCEAGGSTREPSWSLQKWIQFGTKLWYGVNRVHNEHESSGNVEVISDMWDCAREFHAA